MKAVFTDEEIRRATRQNLELHSSSSHKIIDLYSFTEDCPHPNPEQDDKYDGVDELVDEWMERNCAGLSVQDLYKLPRPWPVTYDFIFKNRRRAENNIPLYIEWRQAMLDYEANHGRVCLLSPMGTACVICSEGDDDGYEPSDCYRQSRAREAYEEFWDLFSSENLEYQAKERAA